MVAFVLWILTFGCTAPCDYATRAVVRWDADHPGPLPTEATVVLEQRGDTEVVVVLECTDDSCFGEVDEQTLGVVEFTLLIDGELFDVDLDSLDLGSDPRGCRETIYYDLPLP